MRISLKQGLWERDHNHLLLNLPDTWSVEVLNMEGDSKRVLGAGAYRKTIDSLASLLKDKREICVLFDDISRPTRTYQIVPFLLELFDRCGIRDEQVRFLCALGTHSPLDNRVFRKKLGEEVLERFPVYNHNPYENCEHIGKTKLGTPVIINKEYLSCDVRIGIGSFLLHSFCGFGGGYKIVMPGVSHIDAMMYHHGELLKHYWDTCYGIGRHAGNPLLEDLREYGKIARLDGVINVLVNSRSENVDIYGGEPDGLYEVFAEKALAHYRTPFTRKVDVVFANTYAKANEGVIALSLAEPLLKDEGGYVVVLCDVEAGQVVHYLLGRFGKNSWGRLTFGERIKDSRVRKIFIVSRYRDRASEWWFGKEEDLEFFTNTKDVVERLKDIYKEKTIDVSIVPDGTIQTLA
jgi:nickel-dependent lactate racemase